MISDNCATEDCYGVYYNNLQGEKSSEFPKYWLDCNVYQNYLQIGEWQLVMHK